MGLHVPGAAFETPGTCLREQLTIAAAQRLCKITALGEEYTPLAEVVDEKCIINAIVALLATGGSTNHSIHWIAIARAAGVIIDWEDFSDLSAITPLVARVYPNGSADVNHFHAAGRQCLCHSHPAGQRSAARGRQHRMGSRPAPLHDRAATGRRPAAACAGQRRERRYRSAATGT